MIVAGLQMNIAWEDPRENHARVDAELAGAVAAGARLVVLPEMFATGFSMDAERIAAHAPATRDRMAAWAREHDLWILGGYAEPGNPRPTNTCSIHAPTGEEVLRYRKIHPFSLAREDEHFAAGTELPTVEVEGVRVTPLICYDLRFPEPFRAAADRTDLFCVMANWPETRVDAWRCLLQARAIENLSYVMGVNRSGEGDGLIYSGDSAIHDPMGRRVATPQAGSPLMSADIDPAYVQDVRSRLGFLGDRRPDVYRALEVDRG